MNLTRVLNCCADVYCALRRAGWSAEEAARITTEAARDAVARIPIRPYPTDTRGNDNAESKGHVPEQVDECQGSGW